MTNMITLLFFILFQVSTFSDNVFNNHPIGKYVFFNLKIKILGLCIYLISIMLLHFPENRIYNTINSKKIVFFHLINLFEGQTDNKSADAQEKNIFTLVLPH